MEVITLLMHDNARLGSVMTKTDVNDEQEKT
jgi:hypothetical protein